MLNYQYFLGNINSNEFISTGGIDVSGEVSINVVYSYFTSGGVSIGGTSTNQQVNNLNSNSELVVNNVTNNNVIFSIFTSGGGTIIDGISNQYVIIDINISGGTITNGLVALNKETNISTLGSIILDGSVIDNVINNVNITGDVIVSGDIEISGTNYNMDGGATLGGTALDEISSSNDNIRSTMFFQNVFDQEFLGNWTHGRQFALSFKVPSARRLKSLICSTNPDDIKEVRTLTITSASEDRETIAITLNGDSFNVDVTDSGDILQTVAEIAQGTYDQWTAKADNATIIFTSYTAGSKTGSYSISGTSADGTFERTTVGRRGFDLSTVSNRTLSLFFAYDKDFRNYSSIAINVAGATPGETETHEIVAALNASTAFADRFIAFNNNGYVAIQQKANNNVILRFYVGNTGAETKLKFNKYAGIAELPLYFMRHTIDNRRTYNDSVGQLIPLCHEITASSVANPTVITSTAHGLTSGDSILIVNSNSTPTIDGTRTVTVTGADTFTVAVNVTVAGTRGLWMSVYEQELLSDAGFTPSNAQDDWELLNGHSDIYRFKKNTVDGSNRITQSIEYNAGATAGDLAIKRQYSYTSTNTNPSQTTEIPYVLTSNDLVTPS